ncbi:pseudouridine synthase family protein [Wolffia australiana]
MSELPAATRERVRNIRIISKVKTKSHTCKGAMTRSHLLFRPHPALTETGRAVAWCHRQCMSIGGAGRIPPFFLWSPLRIHHRLQLLAVLRSSTTPGCPRTMVEDCSTEDLHVQYNHTDPCSHLRWTARECYQFMYNRSWQKVSNFYADIICGRWSLLSLFPEVSSVSAGTVDSVSGVASYDTAESRVGEDDTTDFAYEKGRKGRWARSTFKIDLAYHGGSFDGWQRQPGLNTVQGAVEIALGEFVDDKKAQRLKDKSLPVTGCAVVAGRTDKGVSALRQVCSFYTWNELVKACKIKDAINSALPGKLVALSVSEVSRVFHPNFSAKWRRYFYIFPLSDWKGKDVNTNKTNEKEEMADGDINLLREFHHEKCRDLSIPDDGDDGFSADTSKNYSFSVSKVNQLLLQLEGKSLSYKMFARDTKASRSNGPPTECYVFHARAVESRLPCSDLDTDGLRVMCVELVAKRFLRRMVRVLVATAIREAAAGAEEDALIKLMDAACRRATAPPAPAEGLCLADVGYMEFSKAHCLIQQPEWMTESGWKEEDPLQS